MAFRTLFIFSLIVLTGCLDTKNDEAIQFYKELAAIDDYLAGATFVDVTSGNNSGIRIGVSQFGAGAPPHDGQTVTAIYTGRLLSDWSIFETDTITDKLEKIGVTGLRYGIESIPEGTKATIFLTSNNGFGPVGSSKVPGNSTIAYEVFLQKVVKTDDELIQFKIDTAAIRTYLNTKMITATALPTGVWYSIDVAGSGPSPNIYDLVTFHYTGTLLSSGEIFQQGDISKQIIFVLIDGLKICLPLVKKSESATFYIPSGLAYGPVAGGAIPANSNLIFEIELKEVE